MSLLNLKIDSKLHFTLLNYKQPFIGGNPSFRLTYCDCSFTFTYYWFDVRQSFTLELGLQDSLCELISCTSKEDINFGIIAIEVPEKQKDQVGPAHWAGSSVGVPFLPEVT
jgi:hypothetical protein